MSTRKLVTTTCYITATQAMTLKKISERSGVSQAQVIREGIDIAIKIYFDRLESLHQVKAAEKETIRKAARTVEKYLDDTFGMVE